MSVSGAGGKVGDGGVLDRRGGGGLGGVEELGCVYGRALTPFLYAPFNTMMELVSFFCKNLPNVYNLSRD